MFEAVIEGEFRHSMGEIEVHPAVILTGLVQSVAGAPVVEASIEFVPIREGPGTRLPIEGATSDRRGRFALGPVPLMDAVLVVRHSHYVIGRSRAWRPVAGSYGTFDIGAIVLDPGKTLRGRVLDARHAPVAEAEVVVDQNLGDVRNFLAERDPSGIPRMNDLALAAWVLQQTSLSVHSSVDGGFEVRGMPRYPATAVISKGEKRARIVVGIDETFIEVVLR